MLILSGSKSSVICRNLATDRCSFRSIPQPPYFQRSAMASKRRKQGAFIPESCTPWLHTLTQPEPREFYPNLPDPAARPIFLR
jgi:hypothetical protein